MIVLLYICVLSMVAILATLCWILREQGELAYRDRIDGRVKLLETVKQERLEYRALVMSYLREQGKVYVPPADTVEIGPGADQRRDTHPPPVHAFKVKPVPPLIKFKGQQ